MKITKDQVKPIREEKLFAQGGKCALCGLDCAVEDAVLDHAHKSGFLRDSLHRSCNSLLGPIENRWQMYGVTDLLAFVHGVGQYLQKHHDAPTGIRHHTHWTQEEKDEKAAKEKAKKLAARIKAKAKKAADKLKAKAKADKEKAQLSKLKPKKKTT